VAQPVVVPLVHHAEDVGRLLLAPRSGDAGFSGSDQQLLSALASQISAAIYKLYVEANNHNRKLYANNEAVYGLLRYGMPVKTEAGILA
jgi:GAF domain-containing protein